MTNVGDQNDHERTVGERRAADYSAQTAIRRQRLTWVLLITLVVFVIQVIGGFAANSLALIADAGHLLADVGGVALALAAIWIAGRPPSDQRTFGYYRAEILAAVINAVVLMAIAGFVIYEAWQRLINPPEVSGGLMLGIALIGLAGNGISLYLLRGADRQGLNMRAAYLEVLTDLLGSAVVVIAAATIAATGLTAVDALASVLVGLLILPRTWSLLSEAVGVLLEATPKGMKLADVRAHLMGAEGVVDIHDLHVWTITSGMHVASAHVVIANDANPASVLAEMNECLATDFDVEHSTLQLETEDRRRYEEAHHA